MGEKRKKGGRYPFFQLSIVLTSRHAFLAEAVSGYWRLDCLAGRRRRAAEAGNIAAQRGKRPALRFGEIHPEVGEADRTGITVSVARATKEGAC